MPKTTMTSIQIPPTTRNRLRKFGLKGQTYADILESLMDRIDYEKYMMEQYRRLKERSKFIPLEKV